MKNKINRQSNAITIATFWETHRLNKYDYNPPYQRMSVWSEEKQSFLIDSILKNFPMPPIFLHQQINSETGATSYQVIDGKQRLTAITRFIENKIPVSSELGDILFDEELAGSYFSDLSKPTLTKYRDAFWSYLISVEYIDDSDQQIIENMFDRLNRNGEQLNGQELRNSRYHSSALLKYVETFIDHPFWARLLEHVDRARMEDREFISELLFLILEDGPLEAKPALLDGMYEKYTARDPNWSEVQEKFEKITQFMQGLEIDFESVRSRGVSHLYGIWSICWYCIERDVPADKIKENINRFYAEYWSGNILDERVTLYKQSMSSRTKSKDQRNKRLEALRQYLGV